jgi:hypothetical protein
MSQKTQKKSPAEVGRELFEKEDQDAREIGRKFDPKKLLEDSNKLHTFKDPELGEGQFGGITNADMFEINAVENPREKGLKIVYCMLKKAYPELTWEEVIKWPAEKTNRLVDIVLKQSSFLRSPKEK